MRDLMANTGNLHLGVDLGGTKLLVAAYDSDRNPRVWRFATGPEFGPAEIGNVIALVKRETGHAGAAVIGLAVPGLVDDTGTVLESDVLPRLAGWRPDWASAVLNDGEAALVSVAAGEKPEATLAAVGCGTGIVAAIQVAGVRLRRFRPFAGELGVAPCGREGTFDELASGNALLQRLKLDAEEITARTQRGDEQCRKAIRAAGEAFGIGLTTLLHLVHPGRIGLYGGTLRYPGYLEAAMTMLNEKAHPILLRQCRVEMMRDTDLVVAQGALREALRR
ncbi:MAG: ROK family protein [Bryobacterales bacterium]|nr:ROK family protein [Bryobacterales bacterium]